MKALKMIQNLRSHCWRSKNKKQMRLVWARQKDNQNRIWKLNVNKKEINNETEILNQIKLFPETLFQKPSQKDSADEINHFLNTLDIPKLSTNQIILCGIELTEKDLCDIMKSIENDKSPGNNGLTKEFYVIFWMILKQPLFLLQNKLRKERS